MVPSFVFREKLKPIVIILFLISPEPCFSSDLVMNEHDCLVCVVGTCFNYGLIVVPKIPPTSDFLAPSNQTYGPTTLPELAFQNGKGDEASRDWFGDGVC